MATYYVRKNGSGTHTQIQSAIYDAVNGDIVDVGAGTWEENIDFMSKSITLQGAGKESTIIQGKLANDVFANASFFSSEDVITVSSTSGMIRGKTVSGTNITAGSRISEIISPTQFRVSIATAAATDTTVVAKTIASVTLGSTSITLPNVTGIVKGMKVVGTGISAYVTNLDSTNKVATLSSAVTQAGTNVAVSFYLAADITAGSSTITLPSVSGVAVGKKIIGTGVSSVITALNATTKVVTLETPVSSSGTGVVFSFRTARTGVTVTQVTNNGSIPSTILLAGTSNGMIIKNLCAIGFDNSSPGQEAAALGLHANASPGHQNFLIDNCKFTANGDSAVMSGPNPYLSGGTIQNCVFDGKTFAGSEPADVPAFSYFSISGTIKSIGAMSVLTLSSVKGIVVGTTLQASNWSGSASVQSVVGNDVTVNKLVSGSIGDVISGVTASNTAYIVPNVARNFIYIGQNATPCNTQNITFKNNSVLGQSGAVISATGGKTMFNSAVTIESVGGLVENNVINGIFGAGDPNPLGSNYAIRCRQSGIVVRNNINNVKNGRGNTGFYVPVGTSQNNVTISTGLVSVAQTPSQLPQVSSDAAQVMTIPKVSAHPSFSSQGSWQLLTYVYKHKTSSKRLTVSFSSFAAGAEKKMKIRQGVVAGMEFELHKVIISDTSKNLMVVKRSEIENASDYDFTLA